MRFLIILLATLLFAKPATKEDIKELKLQIYQINQKLDRLINKVNEIDKKVNANTIRIEMLEKSMNKRFELMEKRFEQIDKRFEDMNKRFEDMNKRFEDMLNYLWMISAAFLGLTAISIGFAVWDRKSTIKAAKDEIIKEIKEEKLKEFVFELQKLAKNDKELARVLKSFHLM
jgi:chaperonin cofactor prefoldin